MEFDFAQQVQLAQQVSAILIPYLVKGGEAFAGETGKRIAGALWEKFKPKVEEKDPDGEIIKDIQNNPDDKAVQSAFEYQIKKILEKDLRFAKEISITIGEINVSTFQGDVTKSQLAIGDNITQTVTKIGQVIVQREGKGEVHTQALTSAYLQYLIQKCEELPLDTIYRKFEQTNKSNRVPLHDIYTDLEIQRSLHEDRLQKGTPLAEREQAERIPVLTALGDGNLRRLVFVGDPGSGKTTCIHYLTLALAMIQQHISGAEKLLPEKSALVRYFPIRLVLREVVVGHLAEGTAEVLWTTLRSDLAKSLSKEEADQLLSHIRNRVRTQPCLVMLDGLDEVPESDNRRVRLLEAIENFSRSLPTESMVIVTARPYAYDNPKWRLAGFDTIKLLPFSPEQIERFIDRFFQTIRRDKNWDEATATHRSQELNRAVQGNKHLLEMAERPLLLTLIASLNASEGILPDDRAELYEESVGLLLQRWQMRIESRDEEGNLVADEPVAKALASLISDNSKVQAALYLLAYTVHERQGNEPARKIDAPADIRREEILGAFASLITGIEPEYFLNYLENRAGILLGRGEGVYAFPHRSFQEYLAACYLANKPRGEIKQVLVRDFSWWREVVLLFIAKKKRGGLDGAMDVVNFLVPDKPDERRGNIEPLDWKTAALAGQALAEMRLSEADAAVPAYKVIIRRIVAWLVHVLEASHLPPRERAEAGDTLAKLGDPRFDVDHWYLPKEPLLGFVHIPAGEFLMGTKEADIKNLVKKFGGEEEWYKSETHQHKVRLPEYYIARYPVTVAQYKVFVEESGHQPADENSLPGVPNHPVVYVTWYDAFEYCKWLTTQLKKKAQIVESMTDIEEAFWRGLAEGKLVVTLPSEAEWEKAARGSNDARVFPWGDEFDQDKVNNNMIVGSTSAVGCFPHGRSPHEIEDMAGNVWEWTRSEYKKYPFDPKGKLDKIEERNILRVLRGGAFAARERFVRCASRRRLTPYIRSSIVGLRVVVVASPISL